MTNNIDLALLERMCPELMELVEEAMAVKVHFKKKETLRDWPAIQKRVHKTELRITIGEALAIAAKLCEMASENERLRDQTFEAMIDKMAKARVDAAIKQFSAARKGDGP